MNTCHKPALYGSTRLSDLLAAYPWLREALPGVHKNFKLLHSPLGRVMVKTATISEMSRRTGMDETALIEKLTELISLHT